MFKEGIYGKKSAHTREITRKTTNILIARDIDRDRRMNERQDICGVLRVSNTVMAASDDVLAATNGKNANIR